MARNTVIIEGLVAACALVFILLGFVLFGALLCLLALSIAGFSLFSRASIGWRSASATLESGDRREFRIASIILALLVILITTLPMSLCPIWNGEIPQHRNQYEVLADSFLEGHLWLDYDVDPALEQLDNPYDPDARTQAGVSVHWDSAYYEGRYYMYFGVVPVLILFMPFKAITGASLTTYHATQLFTALFEVGLLLLMLSLARRFSPKLRRSSFFLLFVAFSFLSTWYFVSAPAQYCTAISAGICMATWSLFFFVRAVFVLEHQNAQIAMAFLGSLFGVLAIGCRPVVGVTNLVVVPLLIVYLRDNEANPLLIGKLVFAALPYLVIGLALCEYNYLRFGSYFEFGQSYQITIADQHQYGNIFGRIFEGNVLVQLLESFFAIRPGIGFPGIFFEFPLLVSGLLFFVPSVFTKLKDNSLFGVVITIWVSVLVIVVVQCAASPILLERYKTDMLWLMCIAAFVVLMILLSEEESAFAAGVLPRCVGTLAVFAILASILLFFVPNDSNLTAYYLGISDQMLKLMT